MPTILTVSWSFGPRELLGGGFDLRLAEDADLQLLADVVAGQLGERFADHDLVGLGLARHAASRDRDSVLIEVEAVHAAGPLALVGHLVENWGPILI